MVYGRGSPQLTCHPVRPVHLEGGYAVADQNMTLHDDVASEPLRPWLPADLLDNAARTISDNKTIMLGLPVLAGIALVALQAVLTEVAVPGGLSGFFGADDPFGQAGAALL